jgi:hypothetical protein
MKKQRKAKQIVTPQLRKEAIIFAFAYPDFNFFGKPANVNAAAFQEQFTMQNDAKYWLILERILTTRMS